MSDPLNTPENGSTAALKSPPPWVRFLLHPIRSPILRALEVSQDLEAGLKRITAPLHRALEGLDSVAAELVDLTPEAFAALQGSTPKEVGITGDPR